MSKEITDLKKQVAQLTKLISKMTPQTTTKKIEEKSPFPETNISEIPNIIKKMSLKDIETYMGNDIGKNPEKPYSMTNSKFINHYNIVTGTSWKPNITYAHKHQVIRKIINGTSKKNQTKIRNSCLKLLNHKIKNPPKNLFGKTPTENQLTKIADNIQKEINRWV